MATSRQLSFSGGEISPALSARVDLTKYSTGLRTCKNWMVMRHGGVTTRPGTGFVGEVSDSTKTVRLIPFVFNTAQTYVLEFGDLYMRVIKNGVHLTEAAKSITDITTANPAIVTIASHSYSTGDEVFIENVGGMTELNNRNFKIVNVTASTFRLQFMDGTDVDSTTLGAYTSGGTAARVYTIVTTYAEVDLPELRFIQSADVVTLTHPTYPPRELTRTGDIAWSIDDIVFGTAIGIPQNLLSDGPGAGEKYVVTAIHAVTGEESLASAFEEALTEQTNFTWDAVTDAGHYNMYKLDSTNSTGIYGWIAITGAETFLDSGLTPDLLDEPPIDRQPFDVAGDYPTACTYYQQRLIFANTDNDVEGVWASRTALPKNFIIPSPIQDDGAVTFSILGKQVNEIKHMLDLGKLILFTESGEYVVEGNEAGILTPTGVNLRQHTANGCGSLAPIVVNKTALYVQARGSVIRDLGFEFESDGYRGDELTIFSSHLFEGFTIVDWAYQKTPHSIVWAVRSDGVLLGLTYIKEHQVFGWHQHTFEGGIVENVAVVPEGNEDSLYLTVKRTIDGRTVRYVEQMKTRQINDIVDSIFMDSTLSFDGRNTESTTMTLSGGTTWEYDEDLTLTASVAFFESGDIGNAIHITGVDGTLVKCTIKAFTSDQIVTVRPSKTVPAAMRSTAFTDWSKAVDTVSGLWHLEGEDVSIFNDGFVGANPNNSSYDIKTVTNGSVTLDGPRVVIHVGLPITADIETLNLDIAEGPTKADKKKHLSVLTIFLEESRGLFGGVDEDNLQELKIRSDESLGDPIDLETGTVDINIKSAWTREGKILIRQIDPVPASVLAVVPSGYLA